MKTFIFSIFSIILLFTSCDDREWLNPFDPGCPKDIWTPTNFQAIQDGTTVKLTWNQSITNISGFKIDKIANGISSPTQNVAPGISQYVDHNISASGGLLNIYTISAYAGNNFSNSVSAQITPKTVATLTTTVVSSATATTLATGGNITSNGGADITARGVCYSTTQNPSITNSLTSDGTGSGVFTSPITGLSPLTTYYIRAYATNSMGTSYGNQVSGTTLSVTIPTISTNSVVSSITNTTATCGGMITSDGGGIVTVRGICWATTQNPTTANNKVTNGVGTGSFTGNLTGLSTGTTYYLRSFATNSAGTAYGGQVSFITQGLYPTTFSDIDGNVYHAVVIGTQVWMVENLKTTKYRNGNTITNVTTGTAWAASTTGAYCWYNNNSTYKALFGALYNWYAVYDSRGIAPLGWHVPTDAEWTTLTTFLSGESVSGGKLKETGTTHWSSPNTGATNETGFLALPGGNINISGAFSLLLNNGFWWSSTEYSTTNSWFRTIYSTNATMTRANDSKRIGLSVRCIKD